MSLMQRGQFETVSGQFWTNSNCLCLYLKRGTIWGANFVRFCPFYVHRTEQKQ
jgi:hypothetical protein